MNITDNKPAFDQGLFGLGGDGKVADQAQFCAGLQALIDRPREAIRTPQLVERVFKVISETDLSEWPTAEKIEGIVAKVKDRWVKVSLVDSFRHIPRARLKNDCGPKFGRQYGHDLADAKAHELPLSLPEDANSDAYPTRLTEEFLSYLQTGEISEAAFDDNILNLLDLALQHTQEPLVKRCMDFLVDNLDTANLETYLDYESRRNLPRLKWACLSFMETNPEEISQELQEKYQTLYQLALSIIDNGNICRLGFSPSGQTALRLSTEGEELLKKIALEIPIQSLSIEETEEDIFPFLKRLAPCLPELKELNINSEDQTDQEMTTIKQLFPKLTAFGNIAPFLKTFSAVKKYLESLTKPGASESESKTIALRFLNLKAVETLDDSQLNQLTEYLQDVYYLFIKSDKITSLVVPKAKTISCEDCTALTNLEAPKATWVKCNGCTLLTTLEAPKAGVVYCEDCTALTSLEAPEATVIECTSCSALETLHLPLAARVSSELCCALTTLEAPNATHVNCSGCTALKTLSAPVATYLRWDDCKAITSLEMFTITGDQIQYFTALTRLKTHEPEKIDCNHCKTLTTLEAPKATDIDCHGCDALTTLDAPLATAISCRWCDALTTIRAPLVRKINCSGCSALTTLEAPKATRIECRNCTALTILKAPLATTTKCKGCTGVTILEVHGVDGYNLYKLKSLITLKTLETAAIDCHGCDALITLDAPKAAKIDCHGCDALTTLDAPKAEKIDCHRCDALTTIKAPLATQIDCRWCEAVTILDAPNAKLIGMSRMRIKSRMWWNQIRSFLNPAFVFCSWLQNGLIRIMKAFLRR